MIGLLEGFVGNHPPPGVGHAICYCEVLSLPRTFVGTPRRAPSILRTVVGVWIKSLQDCTIPRVHTKTEGLRECTSLPMDLQIRTGFAPCKCAFAT